MTGNFFPVAVLATTLFAIPAETQQSPCGYEPNVGTPLRLGDDSVARGLSLGFAYRFPDGTLSTTVDVDSNGRLAASLAGSDFGGTVEWLLRYPGTICPLWGDLDPTGANADDVYFHALPGKAVITWKDVVYYGRRDPFTVQCTLWADGRVRFVYDSRVPRPPSPGLGSTLVGMSPGNGVVDPGPVDLSSRPLLCPSMTVYEHYRGWDGIHDFDLVDESVEFVPIVGSGWSVNVPSGCASATTMGRACGADAPASFYESFNVSRPNDLSGFAGLTAKFHGGGYAIVPDGGPIVPPIAAPLPLGDDQTVQVPLPWSMATQIGLINDIWVCSNGWVSFTPTMDASFLSGNYAWLMLGGETRIACMIVDLDPGAAGSVHAELDPNDASLFHVTWSKVPVWARGGANTFQLTLRASGSWSLRFGELSATGGIVGYSIGGRVRDPGPTDISALSGKLLIGTDRRDATLIALSRPVLGTTATTETRDIPAGAIAGTHVHGLLRAPGAGFDLAALGAPGCFILASSDATVSFSVANEFARHSMSVPPSAALAGAHLYSQSAILVTGINSLGVITTNGIVWRLESR